MTTVDAVRTLSVGGHKNDAEKNPSVVAVDIAHAYEVNTSPQFVMEFLGLIPRACSFPSRTTSGVSRYGHTATLECRQSCSVLSSS